MWRGEMLTAVHQYFTRQYFLTNLISLLSDPNLPNISPPILGDKGPRCIFVLYSNLVYLVYCIKCYPA